MGWVYPSHGPVHFEILRGSGKKIQEAQLWGQGKKCQEFPELCTKLRFLIIAFLLSHCLKKNIYQNKLLMSLWNMCLKIYQRSKDQIQCKEGLIFQHWIVPMTAKSHSNALTSLTKNNDARVNHWPFPIHYEIHTQPGTLHFHKHSDYVSTSPPCFSL